MKKINLILLLLFPVFHFSYIYASHAKSAEIIYTHLSGYSYEVTIITTVYSPSPADRPELEIKWGDGTSEILPRTQEIELSSNNQRNIYIGEHTYAKEGNYIISMEDPNRNYGIVNIPNSVNIPLYVESLLVINDDYGPNNSVEYLIDPFALAKVDTIFQYNGGAVDFDGDHLTHQLVDCRESNGNPIPGYELPLASNEFSINHESGQLLWDSPTVQGEYIIAIKTTEWRNGSVVGYVIREYQFKVNSFLIDPPQIISIEDTTIYYNQTIDLDIISKSTSSFGLSLNAYGYPLLLDNQPAEFDSVYTSDSCSSVFHWETNYQHARAQSYYIYLVSKSYSSISYPNILTTVKTMKIDVSFYEGTTEFSILNKNSICINSLVRDKLKIKFLNNYTDRVIIQIFTLSGVCIKQLTTWIPQNNRLEVDLSTISNTIYILSMKTGNQLIYSGKIIKQ